MYRLIMVMGAVAALCLATGCGSSGDEEPAATPLTKAQFIKRADEICETVRRQRIAALGKLGKEAGTKVAGAREAAEEVVSPSLAREAEELEGLEAPSSEKAEFVNLTSKLSKMSEAFAGKGSGVDAATALLPKYEREAAALKLDQCMQP